MDAQQIEAIAQAYEDQYRPGEPGCGEAKAFTWDYAPTFPLSLLGPQHEWSTWYAHEKYLWAEEGDPDPFQSLEAWWLATPANEPIIVVCWTDGKYYLWDGNHRVGISATHQQTTAPAYVGTPTTL